MTDLTATDIGKLRDALADLERTDPLPWEFYPNVCRVYDSNRMPVYASGHVGGHLVAAINALPAILDLADEALAARENNQPKGGDDNE